MTEQDKRVWVKTNVYPMYAGKQLMILVESNPSTGESYTLVQTYTNGLVQIELVERVYDSEQLGAKGVDKYVVTVGTMQSSGDIYFSSNRSAQQGGEFERIQLRFDVFGQDLWYREQANATIASFIAA